MIEPVISKQSLFLQVRSKIEEIADIICNLNFNKLSPGLMTGKAGLVLFLVNHARVFRNDDSAEKAYLLINSLIDNINNTFEVFTFSDGLAGIGWLLMHLQQYDMIEFNDEDLESIDSVLSVLMEKDFSKGNYDFLHGGIGYGMYFLERFQKTNDPVHLDSAVNALEILCQTDNDKQKWWETEIHLSKVTRGVNLGLAHGMPGIISFLSRLNRKGINNESTGAMISDGCNYMFSKRQDHNIYRSRYPSWIQKGIPAMSRLAWCYGDPGIGLAFSDANKALGNESWKKEYLEIFDICSLRRSMEDDFVFDAGLCHGSAGLAQIFNRVFQMSKKEVYRESSEFWIRKTLEMATHQDGLAGFKAYRSSQYGGWANEPGLLEGIAGTGLALIASISNEDTGWDKCLLIKNLIDEILFGKFLILGNG